MSVKVLGTTVLPNANEAMIEKVRHEKIKDIVLLHQEAFARVLIGQLGERFTAFFYQRILNSPSGIIYVFKKDQKVVGFISGMAQSKGFMNGEFFKEALMGFFSQIFRNPKVVMSIYRYALKQVLFHGSFCSAELMSIVVEKPFRGQGIGKALVQQLDQFMKGQKVEAYKVFTDLQETQGVALYESLGFQLEQEKKLLGLTTRMYSHCLK